MLAVRLNDEQQDFAAAIRQFCEREFGSRDQRQQLTEGGERLHNQDVFRRMAELGWLGVSIPEEYGGSGAGMVEACIFLETTAYGLAPIQAVGSTLISVGPYERFGTEEQKAEVLGGIAAGAVESIAMSEPGAGSDVAAMRCRAVRTDDGFVVNGQKTWVSNADLADHVLLVCRTGDAGKTPHDGLTMLVVPRAHPGMEIRAIPTLGGEQEVNDVFFTDCEIPTGNLLGEDGNGWRQLTASLNLERLVIAADCLGKAQRAFDDALAFVRDREQFGQPVGSFQAIKHRIADLATELECARLLVYEVAAMVDREPGKVFPREASMAKLKASELARRCALEGVQMMGGYGFATEYEMVHHVRQSIATTIYGGTSEIQRDIIGRSFGL
jgi:isovaleryl-CoA dehydrogenase